MYMPVTIAKRFFAILLVLSFSLPLLAHNGSVAYAYPLGHIKADGDFADWPAGMAIYKINRYASDDKPKNANDFSAFFRIGYRAAERSLYVALQVTDDDFIQDTSAQVSWNSQDGVELYLDARHLPVGSGVASFLYSEKLRHTNNAYFDPFAKNAKWNVVDVGFKQKGNTRYYEWRIQLSDQFAIGKSIGIDVHVFDMDKDKTFTIASWGSGDMKFMNPLSLGDVVLLPAAEKLAALTGQVAWDKKISRPLPAKVRLANTTRPEQWITVAADSTGRYTAQLPAGLYSAAMLDEYWSYRDTLYTTQSAKPVTVTALRGKAGSIPRLVLPSAPTSDLVPEKGILLNAFTPATAGQIDQFIKSYQRYYHIPGASLAIIKDGQIIYHQTYGVKNTFTGQPVDGNTLFEAASVTKPVFAYAVQRLAERQIIHLDTPLYRYLPNPDIAYDERYKLITARHVLTHRTGFPNWRWMNNDGKLNLKFTPGTGYGYSGEGFEYLKQVIKEITGKKIEQVLQEEVIEPMGLYHTFFSRNDSLRQMVAEGHYNQMPNYDELPESPGMAWSMHTEAKIFTRFMQHLLDEKGLSAETYTTMLAKHSEFDYPADYVKPKIPGYMGMSLEVRETPWGKSFGHGGNNGDFTCTFRVYKDLKIGYVLFTNSNTSDLLLENIGKLLVEGQYERQ